MRNISKIILVILLILILIFISVFFYFNYLITENYFSEKSIESRELYCYRQEACDECNRELNCIIKICEKEPIDFLVPGESQEELKQLKCSKHPDIESGYPEAFITGFCGDNFRYDMNCGIKKSKIEVFFEWQTMETSLQWIGGFLFGFQ